MGHDTLLCFEGLLQENMVFEPGRGVETTRIPTRPPEVSGSYVIELLDEGGYAIVQVKPHVDFEDACFDPAPTMRAAWVMAYVPYHPSARRLVFRRDDYVIYAAPVAMQQPRVEIEAVESDRESVALQWSASHFEDFPLTYNVFCIAQGRVLMLARNLQAYEATFSLGSVPGGVCRLAVVATDGLRSGHAVSDSVEVAEKPPELWITSPREGAVYPPDQPISLIGQVVDSLGVKQTQEGLMWEVDERVVQQNSGIAPAFGLQPGTHVATLSWQGGRYKTVRASIRFAIADYNEAQLRYKQLMGIDG